MPPDTASIPIAIGEIKIGHLLASNFENTCYQLLYYQLAVQRPLLRSSSQSDQILLGFVMDSIEAAIIELNVNSWTSSRPLDPIHIERFDVRNTDQRIKFFSMLLLRVLNALTIVNAIKRLKQPLLLFGPEINKIHDINQCIIKTSSTLLEPFVQKFNKSPDSRLIFLCEEAEQKLILPPNTDLVFKVFGELFSGGMYSETLRGLLILLILARLRPKLSERLHWLYVALFKVIDNHPFRFAITRFVSGTVCSDSHVMNLWKENEQSMGSCFFTDVYEVAIEALDLGFYHWDIRLPNIIFDNDENNQRFVIIDWESIVSTDSKDVAPHCPLDSLSEELRSIFKPKNNKIQAAFFLFKNLLLCLRSFNIKYASFDKRIKMLVASLRLEWGWKEFRPTLDKEMKRVLKLEMV